MTRAGKAEELALQTLEEAGETQVPIRVEMIAHHLGAEIRYEPFEHDVSGILFRDGTSSPIIGVNSANAPARQRFTIAHEIGHLEMHEGTLILDRLVRVNFRDAASSSATVGQEIEANAFAACLLMPPDTVERRLEAALKGPGRSDDELVDRLAREFRVSRSAMEYRLINLGHLNPG